MIFQTSFHISRHGMAVDVSSICARLVNEGGATHVEVQCADLGGQPLWLPADKIDLAMLMTSESIYDGYVVISMQVECACSDRMTTALQELGHDGYPHTKPVCVNIA